MNISEYNLIVNFFFFPILLFTSILPQFFLFHDANVVRLVEVCKALCAVMKNILSSTAVRYFS